MVSLSGARRRAAKGRLVWVVWAVCWRIRQLSAAALSWVGVRGVRVGFGGVIVIVGGLISLFWLRGMNACIRGCGDLVKICIVLLQMCGGVRR